MHYHPHPQCHPTTILPLYFSIYLPLFYFILPLGPYLLSLNPSLQIPPPYSYVYLPLFSNLPAYLCLPILTYVFLHIPIHLSIIAADPGASIGLV